MGAPDLGGRQREFDMRETPAATLSESRAGPLVALWTGLCVALSGCTGVDPTPRSDNSDVTGRGEGKDDWYSALPRAAWSAFERVDQSQDWFEVYRIADGVHAIYEPGQFEEVVSFLVTGNDKALLVDTGLGIGDMKQLVSELTPLPVVVLNSHTHYDHIGGNHAFDTVYAVDTPYTRARAGGLAHDEVAEFVGPGWIWKATPPGFDPSAYRSRPFEIDRFVTDGQIIDLGGRTLEVLLTPGHAPDALCLLDRDNRLLFTGDTFYLASLYTHLPGSDFDQYARTARRLAALAPQVDTLLTAHNVPTVHSDYLARLAGAFAAIEAGTADYVVTDGFREYGFDGFSIITE